jgi:CheY-like chemotaxis protein/predicted regulator of Ras-like GTPase activity (Roadblock/LC7/MglB family)
MAPKILVVDRNQAFATMLEQMLEIDGGYEVKVARSGSGALAHLRQADCDLTIVDMDLDPADMGYRDLILNVRQIEPTMRVMVIPLMGRDLPPEAHEMDLQGALSKPFFADDLLPAIKDALVKRVNPATPQPSTPLATPRSAPQSPSGLQPILSELAHEINADAVLLLSTTDGDEKVVAHVSTMDRSSLETLSDLGIATAVGRSLGQPDKPFEHNMFESDSQRLYMMALPRDRLLVVITLISTPLGTIRHNLRRAVRGMDELASA